MSVVGLVQFARVALMVSEQILPAYSHRFSPQRFRQPQLLAILCLMRYEDWTFRTVEVRIIAQVLAEVVRRLEKLRRKRGPMRPKLRTVAVDATGLSPGAISTFFVRRREHHGGKAMPWRYWLKWLLAIDVDLRVVLAQSAHQ